MRGPSGFRKNNGNYPISIYRYPEYAPYFSVISMMIKRELADAQVVSRSKIIDLIEVSVAYRHITEGFTRPDPGMWRPKERAIRYKERRIWNVIGVIMRDLGFHKYSDHAWSRGPVVECGQALPMGLA